MLDAIVPMRCWKCPGLLVEKKTLIGKLRTTAQQILNGEVDENMYTKFYVCQECKAHLTPYQDKYLRQVVYRRERNEKVAALACRFAKNGHTCFVFTYRIEHVELLSLMIQEEFSKHGIDPQKCRAVNGGLEAEKNDEVKRLLIKGEVLAVVGTSVWGEGTNVPTLRWVINAEGGNPGIKLDQLVGRLTRRSDGKWRGGYVDFLDEHDKAFANKSKRRAKYLQEKGFPVSVLRPVPSRRGEPRYFSGKLGESRTIIGHG